MAARDWRRASDYADLAAADLATLAWEFLRRNPAYREDVEGGGGLLSSDHEGDVGLRWGLRFAVSPDRSADEAPVFWRAEVAPPHVVVLTRSLFGGVSLRVLERSAAAVRAAEDGVHLRLRDGLQLFAPAGVDPDAPLAAAAALDADLALGLSGLGALARQLDGAPTAPDPLSSYSRGRAVSALRALDGRAAGASYRDVAEHVLRRPADGREAWRVSTARDVAIRLCRTGARLVAGGYRQLLRRRR